LARLNYTSLKTASAGAEGQPDAARREERSLKAALAYRAVLIYGDGPARRHGASARKVPESLGDEEV
jgi:hypothetical protein